MGSRGERSSEAGPKGEVRGSAGRAGLNSGARLAGRRFADVKRMNRRTIVEMLAAGTAFAAAGGPWSAAFGQAGVAAAPEAEEGAAIPRKLRGRASKEIARSPLSVGFETLDR